MLSVPCALQQEEGSAEQGGMGQRGGGIPTGEHPQTAESSWRSSQQLDDPHTTLGLQAGDFSGTSDISVISPSLLQKPLGEDGCDADSPQSPPASGSLGDGERSCHGQCCPRTGLTSSVLHMSDTRWCCRSFLFPAWKTRVSLAEPWTLSGWESTPLLNAASPGGQIQCRLWCV